jgi:RNase P protein component
VLRAALREIRTRHGLRGHIILVARRSLIDDGLRSTELEPELERLLRGVGSLEGART